MICRETFFMVDHSSNMRAPLRIYVVEFEPQDNAPGTVEFRHGHVGVSNGDNGPAKPVTLFFGFSSVCDADTGNHSSLSFSPGDCLSLPFTPNKVV
jgi:hypothetical protein